jgi:hypothetical protein
MKRALLVVALCFSVALRARESRRLEWRDTYKPRLEVLVQLQSLNGEILAGSSTTSSPRSGRQNRFGREVHRRRSTFLSARSRSADKDRSPSKT